MRPNKARIFAGVGAVASAAVALALAISGLDSWTYFGLIGLLLGAATLGALSRL